MRRNSGAVGMVIAAALSMHAAPAFAVGALAASPDNSGWGASWGYGSRSAAAQSAISACRGSYKVILYFSSGCGAYAADRGVGGSAATGTAGSKSGAERMAVRSCEAKGGGNCRVIVSACE